MNTAPLPVDSGSRRSDIAAIRKDMRQFGILLLVAGLIGFFVDPAESQNPQPLILSMLGSIAWGSTFIRLNPRA